MKKIFIILSGICMLLIFASCGNAVVKISTEPEIEVKPRIVKAKTIEIVDGSAFSKGRVYYVIAFTSGETDYVTFGEFSNIEVNDTLIYTKKSDDYFWELKLNE